MPGASERAAMRAASGEVNAPLPPLPEGSVLAQIQYFWEPAVHNGVLAQMPSALGATALTATIELGREVVMYRWVMEREGADLVWRCVGPVSRRPLTVRETLALAPRQL